MPALTRPERAPTVTPVRSPSSATEAASATRVIATSSNDQPWTLTVIATEALSAIETAEVTVTVVAVVPEEEHAEGSDVLSLDHVRLALYAA